MLVYENLRNSILLTFMNRDLYIFVRYLVLTVAYVYITGSKKLLHLLEYILWCLLYLKLLFAIGLLRVAVFN